MSWIWLPIRAVYVIHDRQIARHGGAPGLRDAGLLENACSRPMNAAAYGTPDAFELAAAYAFGIAKAHAFIDGNKRTAFVACATFLRMHGHHIKPDPGTGVGMMEDLAASILSEGNFAAWLRDEAA